MAMEAREAGGGVGPALDPATAVPVSPGLPACPTCGARDAWGSLVRWVSNGALEAVCDRCHVRFSFLPGGQASGAGSLASPQATAPRRLLVIEDDRLLTDAFRVGFEAAGYAVLVASNGYTGLRLAREHQPDLVLLDLQLPELSGQQVLAELGREPRTADIPVVVVTGRAEVLADPRAVTAVLHKPAALPTVLAAVGQALDGADPSTRRPA